MGRASRAVPSSAEERVSPGRGIHHAALICSDVERTIRFYQDVLGFPLVELVENRDYKGSSHFFFVLGNKTLPGFFDFPRARFSSGYRGHRRGSAHRDFDATGEVGAGPEAAGGGRRDVRRSDLGIEESMYFQDPDGIQIELLSVSPLFFVAYQLDE